MDASRNCSTYPVILLPPLLRAYLKFSSFSPVYSQIEEPKFPLISPHKYKKSVQQKIWIFYGILNFIIIICWSTINRSNDLLILAIGLLLLLFAFYQISISLQSDYQNKYQKQYQEYEINLASYRDNKIKLEHLNKVSYRIWLRKQSKFEKLRKLIIQELLEGKIKEVDLEYVYPEETLENEDKFCILMQNSFGERITVRKVLSESPTYVLIDNDTALHFIIFIDIPYTEQKLLHYIGNEKDEIENQKFLNSNWIVIRFAEQQIVLWTEECCRAIAQVYFELTHDERFTPKESERNLPRIERWTEEEAQKMLIWEKRHNYHQGKF